MSEIPNVLTASYEFSDEPLDVTEIDGLEAAIEQVQQTKKDRFVEAPKKIPDYKVYWNEKTDSVRVGAIVIGASYEVQA